MRSVAANSCSPNSERKSERTRSFQPHDSVQQYRAARQSSSLWIKDTLLHVGIASFDPFIEPFDRGCARGVRIFIYGNRAHALMLLGQADEARAIYLQYRGKTNVVGEKSWETAVLDDFAELRKAGLNHPLMDEIEGLFSQTNLVQPDEPDQAAR